MYKRQEKYLKALKPNIAGWEADFGKEMMTKNKAWLNMTWSGDCLLYTSTWDDLMDLGRNNPGDKGERFCMSVFACNTSQEVNGVS